MLNYLQKPASFNLSEILSADKWDFAKKPAANGTGEAGTLHGDDQTKLKNWDADRVAALEHDPAADGYL